MYFLPNCLRDSFAEMAILAPENSLPPALQAVINKEEIRTVIYQFARGADRRIRDLVQSVYHPEANDNHGTFNGPAKNFYDAMTANDTTHAVHHQIGQSLIELGNDGSTARAETYCTATTVDGDNNWIKFLVRYVDQFEKREGAWKISDRCVVFDAVSDKAIMDYLPKSNMGTRDETDFSRKILSN